MYCLDFNSKGVISIDFMDEIERMLINMQKANNYPRWETYVRGDIPTALRSDALMTIFNTIGIEA